MISARLLLLVGVLGIISQPPRMIGNELSTRKVVLRMVGPGGSPPQQVEVVLRNVDSQEVRHLRLRATPGTESFRMQHLPLGRYSLTATSGVWVTQKNVELQVGSATKHTS